MEGRCSIGGRSFMYRVGQKYYSQVMQLKSLEMTPFTAGYEDTMILPCTPINWLLYSIQEMACRF